MAPQRPSLAVLPLAAAALAAAVGCGGSSAAAPATGPFAWLRPGPPPAGWSTARLPDGAILARPPGWRPIRTDPGTASAALMDRGRLLGYLNATPRQGAESLANWAAFRPDHDREEGNRSVRVLAAGRGLPFRGGTGSCVQDRYVTSTGARYVELACLVVGRRSSAVIVAAAPPGQWSRRQPEIRRAIDAFVA